MASSMTKSFVIERIPGGFAIVVDWTGSGRRLMQFRQDVIGHNEFFGTFFDGEDFCSPSTIVDTLVDEERQKKGLFLTTPS